MAPLSRRDLLVSAGAASAALLIGCAGSGDGAPIDAPVGPGDSLGPDAGPRADAADATPTVCDEDTADNLLGPFYKAGAPVRSSLVEPGDPGVRLALSGTVVAVGTCAPIAGATLDVWQADDDAVYDTEGFRYRGKVITDDRGAWSLATIVPGHYLNGAQYRPAHIHVRLTGPGLEELVTQLYFEGDPYNDVDPFIVDSLIMRVEDDGSGGKRAAFRFVMRETA